MTSRRISVIIAILTLLYRHKKFRELLTKIRKNKLKESLFALVICAIIVSFNSLGVERNSGSTYFEIWYFVNLILYVPVFAFYCAVEFKNAKSFLYVYAGCFILQAIAVYMAVVDSTVRILLYELFYTGDDRFVDSVAKGTRIMGIALHSSTGSIICSTSIVLATYCYLKHEISMLSFCLLSIVFISTTMFIGRTGLLIEVVCFIYAFLAENKRNKIGGLIFAGIAAIIVFYIVVEILSRSDSVFGGEALKNWISEAFNRNGQKNTMDQIVRVMPPFSSEFILGTSVMNGRTPDGSVFDTDSGYIMIYASLGIVGALFYYLANISLYQITKTKKIDKVIYKYIILLSFLSFAIEYKEPFMLKYVFSFIIVTLSLFNAKEFR